MNVRNDTVPRGAATEGKTTNASKALEATLRKEKGGKYRGAEDGFIQEVETPKEYAPFAKAIQRLTGTRVVFVQQAGDVPLDFNGVFIGGKTLYVNAAAKAQAVEAAEGFDKRPPHEGRVVA